MSSFRTKYQIWKILRPLKRLHEGFPEPGSEEIKVALLETGQFDPIQGNAIQVPKDKISVVLDHLLLSPEKAPPFDRAPKGVVKKVDHRDFSWREIREITSPDLGLTSTLLRSKIKTRYSLDPVTIDPDIQRRESEGVRYSLTDPDAEKDIQWVLKITPTFAKSLKRFDNKLKGRVMQAITEIISDPTREKGDTIKALGHNKRGLWRYRIGAYRLIYAPESPTVSLLHFSSRGTAYEE